MAARAPVLQRTTSVQRNGSKMARRAVAGFSLALCTVLAHPAVAEQAIVLDDVVAVVGEEPILRSEVVAKARLTDAMVRADSPIAVAAIQRAVLEETIDGALIMFDASRLGLTASPLEVSQGKERLARKAGKTQEQFLAELKRRGLWAHDFDLHVKREILEQKWLALVVKPNVKMAPPLNGNPDAEAAFFRELGAERKRALGELRKSVFVEIRW